MIPIRDTVPCYHTPYVTWGLMAVNVTVFAFMMAMPPQMGETFLYLYGLVAKRYTHPEWAAQMGFPPDNYFSFLSHMFLHNGWLHIIMNMWFLYIFGDNIEDRMGKVRFLAFYLLCGLVAASGQVYFNPDTAIPVVGASGAIAGIMGAYFMLYPYARIVLWLPLFFLPIFFELPAIAFLGLWAIMQMHKATTAAEGVADVAWWGHLGGFVAGLLMYRFFLPKESVTAE
ncbi:MAG: rhomboid family intramembrane serine protease [Gammaproteobacteria bacterium]